MIANRNIKKVNHVFKTKKVRTSPTPNKVKLTAVKIDLNIEPGLNTWLNEYCTQMFFLS